MTDRASLFENIFTNRIDITVEASVLHFLIQQTNYRLSLNRNRCIENTNRWQITHWDRDKISAIFMTIFLNAFSWMRISKFLLWFHWNLFMCHVDYIRALVQKWLGDGQATTHYLKIADPFRWCIYAALGEHELSGFWWRGLDPILLT